MLLIQLLDRGNLRGQHCYLGPGPSLGSCLPPTWAGSLGEVAPLGIVSVYLRRRRAVSLPGPAPVFAEAAEQKGLDVCVATNGILIGPKQARVAVLGSGGFLANAPGDDPNVAVLTRRLRPTSRGPGLRHPGPPPAPQAR